MRVTATQSISQLGVTGLNIADKPAAPVLLHKANGSVDATSTSGLGAKIPCNGASAGDLDNDMDVYIISSCTGGAQNVANIVYENLGDGTFRVVPNAGGAAGFVGPSYGVGMGSSDNVSLADYDVDGFLDAMVFSGANMRPQCYGGPKQLFHNVGNANRWIELDLEAISDSRDGTGAKVYVTAGGKTQLRERNGGYHRWT